MLQEQEFVTSGGLHRNIILPHARSYRFLSSLLIGAGVGLILVLLQVCLLWLLNPFHLPGSPTSRLFAILALPLHMPGILLILLLELALAFIAVLLLAKPIKLAAYLNAVHAAQKEYHKLYTPLTALANLRQPSEEHMLADTHVPATPIPEEPVSILDLVKQQDTHQMILGLPGAGKTMALKVYQYEASRRPWSLVFSQNRIPVFVPMKNYSLFLKQHEPHMAASGATRDAWQVTLLDFLFASDLAGLRHLRPYLQRLSEQGRLLLLCDGLNEVDSNYLRRVSEELVYWMRMTRNRLVMTCREVDYREQPDFIQLVEGGQALRAVLYPLQPEQISEFVERYVVRQDQRWQHTAGQIMQVIDRSRLRYHCTNPMMLFTLMGIIDKIGVERGKQIDTRGRLLRESVRQLIEYEQLQPRWSKGMPTEREVIRFLSEVACAARWANDRNAIQLRISAPAAIAATGTRARANFDELADELRFWLDEHPARGPFNVPEEDEPAYELYEDLAQLLQFSLSAALIEISSGGVLSFRHELITEYFVAEYFFAADSKRGSAAFPMREELLENVGRWSEPVAIWAGLMDNPLVLAERFGTLGRSNPAYVLQALALGLVCIGVLWTPPQAEQQRTVVLPPAIAESLSVAVRNKAAREELARIFTRCAEEGGQEVYRSLLPLIMVEGVDELLTLLDQTVVPDLLFTHLQDAIDDVVYESQVKRITRVLGRFGSVAVDRAAQLALPAPERSIRLRAAVINILGGTADFRAVDPLIARLSDAEMFVVERATNALIRLGPELTLARILQELEKRTPGPITRRIHGAALLILGRFLEEQDPRRQVSLIQYQRILESVVPVLTSNYQSEPEVQELARNILVRQGRNTDTRDNRWQKVIDALIQYLSSQNEIAAQNVILALQAIGEAATPHLLTQLNQATELVSLRVIEIFKLVRDLQALPHLLRLVNDQSPLVQQQIGVVLQVYAPDSIPGLIDLVQNGQSDAVAERAAQILSNIGEPVVEPVIGALSLIVPVRTRFLVQVLSQVQDLRAVPALITLLQTPGIEPLLAIAVVRALSQYPDKRVVPPLLSVLSSSNPQLYEEGIDALSQLGEITLDGLFASLNGPLDSVVTQRVRRAILGMAPFPGESLIALLEQSSNAQAQQIVAIFKAKGIDAAQVLARHLLHRDEKVREYIYQMLNEMPGSLVVPALLDVLDQLPLRKVASSLLLKYPDAAVSPLVDLLSEHERGDAAAMLLPQFGPKILRALISGLDDVRSLARERTQGIIVTLVRQQQNPQEILHDIVHLFNPEPPLRAREALLSVLTNELADISIPALLAGLEDAHLIEDVSEAFAMLARKTSLQEMVLESLLQALYVSEKRRGAALALIKIDAPAVARVGALITDSNQAVARIAQQILLEIGVPALPFIWTAHSDLSNPARRDAALEIFHSMPTSVIKDALVSRLVSDRPDDITMAVTLLLERIRDEAEQQYADQVMIPELVDYVQAHNVEKTNLRIIALLLLLGERVIKDHFIQALEDLQQPRKQMIYALLLLGEETQGVLLDLFSDPDISVEMQAELAMVLGMVSAPETVAEYAQNISKYGLSSSRTSPLFPEQLAVSLRALGGLLAGGHWNVRKIQELRDTCKDGSPARELFNVLLGMRYEPQLARLQSDLQSERDAHKKEMVQFSTRIMESQQRIQTLTEELEQIRQEHGVRNDELFQATREKEALRINYDRAAKENNILNNHLEQTIQERDALKEDFEQLLKEREMLNARLAQALQENQELHRDNAQLIWKLKHP